MKKRILCMFLAFVIAIGCIGCSNEESPDTNANKEKEEDVLENKVIKVGWFTSWYEDPGYYDFIFEGFKAAYPEYTVERQDVVNISQLVSQIQAGTQPDIWIGGDPNSTNFTVGYFEGLFQNLDEYLANDSVLNLETLDNDYMKICEFGDSYYALPMQISQQCIVYNKTLFAKAGLDPDSPPKTWDEFYDYAVKLTQYDSNGFITQLGVTDGPSMYQIENLDGSTGKWAANSLDSTYNTEWMAQAAAFEAKMLSITEGKSGAEGVEFHMSNGNVGMQVANFQHLSGCELDREEMGVACLPAPDADTKNYVPTWLWYFAAIPTGCENPDGGWLFAKYLMTEGLYNLASNIYLEDPLNYIPQRYAHLETRERIYTDFVSQTSEETQNFIAERDAALENEVVVKLDSPIQDVFTEVNDKWCEKYDNGEVGFKEAMEGIYNEYQAQLETWKQSMELKGWQFPEGEEAIPPEE